ncbi:MAG: DNA-formamidopyrimidine glycosylase, partial [Deltaproteobacteria bacterium]|nr:DNA-formamidopyrimidine glycosylase [Deltaproteobacteria bacterium]
SHTHLQFEFADGGPRVFFRDVRKFGKVAWFPPGEKDPRLAKLGPDALEITGDQLAKALVGRKLAIKSLLLNQSVLAGVGNIYADEALFHAGIDPRRSGSDLSPRECKALIKAVKRVLRRSIETGGSSISDYINPDGADGQFQDERCVYGLTGQPCSTCQSPIKRVRQGQRSTHFCPTCQN